MIYVISFNLFSRNLARCLKIIASWQKLVYICTSWCMNGVNNVRQSVAITVA